MSTGTIARRRVAVVTGSRAEFGLLAPVIRAIEARDDLAGEVLVTGTHLLPPAETVREVEAEFAVAARIPMQTPDATGRAADAAALGRGVSGFAERLAAHPPDVVLVLGDRIEAFAAASAAAVAGIRVAHMHGGDRAEGIADEALRHAITKLAHIHLPATGGSTERLLCLGEDPARIHLVGSPAIDDLDRYGLMLDDEYEKLGRPRFLVLMHPDGDEPDDQWANAERLLRLCAAQGATLALHPNHDAGRVSILDAIEGSGVPAVAHLPRRSFVGLLRRVDMLVGNSSAGLIEAAALGVRCVNVGTRQSGREMPANVLDVPDWEFGAIDMALERAGEPLDPYRHPYGEGTAGHLTAAVLATFDPDKHPLRKSCTF